MRYKATLYITKSLLLSFSLMGGMTIFLTIKLYQIYFIFTIIYCILTNIKLLLKFNNGGAYLFCPDVCRICSAMRYLLRQCTMIKKKLIFFWNSIKICPNFIFFGILIIYKSISHFYINFYIILTYNVIIIINKAINYYIKIIVICVYSIL